MSTHLPPSRIHTDPRVLCRASLLQSGGENALLVLIKVRLSIVPEGWALLADPSGSPALLSDTARPMPSCDVLLISDTPVLVSLYQGDEILLYERIPSVTPPSGRGPFHEGEGAAGSLVSYDLRVPLLEGNEWVVMRPGGKLRIATQIPGVAPLAIALVEGDGKGVELKPVALVCDTIAIDLDHKAFTLVFRGLLDLGAGATAKAVVAGLDILGSAVDVAPLVEAARASLTHSIPAPPRSIPLPLGDQPAPAQAWKGEDF